MARFIGNILGRFEMKASNMRIKKIIMAVKVKYEPIEEIIFQVVYESG